MKIQKTCLACGAKMMRYESQIRQGRGNYCSRACNASKNLIRNGATRHGMSGSPTYTSWAAMMARCYSKNSTKYPSYGGVGISVCKEWRSFSGFYRSMGERPLGTTIDRIDGTLGYSPENCRWATIVQQQNNLKNTVKVPYLGREYTLTDLCDLLEIKRGTLSYRIKNGWPEASWGTTANYRARTRPASCEPDPSSLGHH